MLSFDIINHHIYPLLDSKTKLSIIHLYESLKKKFYKSLHIDYDDYKTLPLKTKNYIVKLYNIYELKINDLPQSLTHLTFGDDFNKNIDHDVYLNH